MTARVALLLPADNLPSDGPLFVVVPGVTRSVLIDKYPLPKRLEPTVVPAVIPTATTPCGECKGQFDGKMPGWKYGSNWDWVPCRLGCDHGTVSAPWLLCAEQAVDTDGVWFIVAPDVLAASFPGELRTAGLWTATTVTVLPVLGYDDDPECDLLNEPHVQLFEDGFIGMFPPGQPVTDEPWAKDIQAGCTVLRFTDITECDPVTEAVEPNPILRRMSEMGIPAGGEGIGIPPLHVVAASVPLVLEQGVPTLMETP